MQCHYAKKFTKYIKYCGKEEFISPRKIVETAKSERNGHMSIRDHRANLTFTVTLKNLTKDDEDTYVCGIDIPWDLDPTSKVMVSVFSGELHTALY